MLRAMLMLATLAVPAFAGAAALVVPEGAATVLRIHGSNTIGAQLGPALAEGLLREQGLQAIRIEAGPSANEQRVTGRSAAGEIMIEVAAHGSGTGFSALKAGNADIAASSRPIKDKEIKELAEYGDMTSVQAEQVIAIDGVAVIVHPGNPVRQLSTEQLAGVFAGEIHNWQELGGVDSAIHVYARDEQSGTFDTFRELVLLKYRKTLAPGVKRFESSEQLSDEVSQDRGGIGFIGLPYVRRGKALAVADGDSTAMLPTVSLIATEDYPLSRRLYFYLPAGINQPWAQALVGFAQSPAGQDIVARTGFVAQSIQPIKVQPSARMPADYLALTRASQRLSVNFRFAQGSARLDNKALLDVQRVVDYLKHNGKQHQHVTLVGFGDAKTDPQRALLLSRLRAMAVRREMLKADVSLRDVLGLGDEMPVATNDADDGRQKNRRVEVWID
jgi:phosphate transport system substrate-binding protein